MKTILLTFFALASSIMCVSATENVIYVSPDGTGNGTSWTDATDFNSAAYVAGLSEVKPQIWVKEGTYSFTVPVNFDHLFIYGGFKGNEISLDQRNWTLNQTILDGGGVTSVLRNTTGDNRGGNGVSIPCLLDGIIVQNGYISGQGNHGGGMYVNRGAQIKNCIFRNNKNNGAHGGALYCQGHTNENRSEYKIENSLFVNNYTHQNGAGVQVAASARGIFVNCTFANNKANNQTGGGVGGGGGNNSEFIFINTIAYNNYGREGAQAPEHIKSSYGVGANVNDGAVLFSLHSAFESESNKFSPGDNVVDHIVLSETVTPSVTPMFKSPSTIIGHSEDETEKAEIFAASYELTASSPCIDTGITTGFPEGITITLPVKDLAGNARIQGDKIDMGAYEFVVPSSTSAANSKTLSAYVDGTNIYVIGAAEGKFLEVYDTLGKLVQRQKVNGILTEINVKNKGIYIVISDEEAIKVSF